MNRKSLVCDLAETYGIFDFKGVSPRLLGTLAAGLGAESRIGKELNGVHGSTVELLLAELIDSVNILIYGLLSKEDAEPPESRKELFFIEKNESSAKKEKEYESFATGEEFHRRRTELMIGGD